MNSLQTRRPFSVERRSERVEPEQSHSLPPADETEILALREDIALLRAEMAVMRDSMIDGSTPDPSPAPTPAEPAPAEPDLPTASGPDEVQAVQVEIAQLVKSIAKAKHEIAAIKHPMADDDRLLAASNELDAIVCATEVATCDILDAAEVIETEAAIIAGIGHDNPELVQSTEKIVGEVVKIMEASNFQDITGQRITKVVETVRFIEQRVLSMIDIWGVDAFAEMPVDCQATGDSDDDLLNGPQLENQGISQADIDALFD